MTGHREAYLMAVGKVLDTCLHATSQHCFSSYRMYRQSQFPPAEYSTSYVASQLEFAGLDFDNNNIDVRNIDPSLGTVNVNDLFVDIADGTSGEISKRM
jgi:hypothetical protein